MLKNKILITLLIGIMLLASCKPQAATTSASLTAALSELVGKVDMKPADADKFTPATANSVLQPNGQIQTGDDGRVRLDLSSGTIIRVASSSSFTLTSNEQTDKGLITKLNLAVGQIFIILNGGSTEVDTRSGVAFVRGSYMMVEVDETTGIAYVTCLEGDCSVTNDAGTVHFTTGQRTTLFPKDPATGKEPLPVVEPMTDKEFQAWLDANPEAKKIMDQLAATATNMPATATEAAATEAPATQAPASNGCNIINPPAGSALPFQGLTKFEWEAQPGAKEYIVTFTTISGNTVSFTTTNTSIEKYIEIFPQPGDYKWDVTALGDDGIQLCKSNTETFTKPNSIVVMPKPPADATQPPEMMPTQACEEC